MSKFLETLEKYTKELGITLNEDVPPVTPEDPNNTGTQNDPSNLSINDLQQQSADHLKTIQDVTQRINSNSATAQDYDALNKASAGLNSINQAKAKLAQQNSAAPGTAANSTVSPSTPDANSTNNPLIKPLV